MSDPKQQKLKFVLVGDHLGQVKKVLQPSGEISNISCAPSSSSNPVVSIENFADEHDKRLIANKNGDLYIYDCTSDDVETLNKADGPLNKAITDENGNIFLIYDNQISIYDKNHLFLSHKKGSIKSAKVSKDSQNLAIAGKEIPLNVYDIETKKRIFQADLPERDWLGIQPDCFVADIDFVGGHRVATCSKSDSVIRVYDVNRQERRKPIISINIDQTAFNEHADSARFHSITSGEDPCHSIVVGSNVGQILAVDLRFNVKEQPKKRKMQPRTYKVLGGFKGPRGASIKDLKLIPSDEPNGGHYLISCCLDRYLRIHNFNHKSRDLVRHVYMITKPLCCCPV